MVEGQVLFCMRFTRVPGVKVGKGTLKHILWARETAKPGITLTTYSVPSVVSPLEKVGISQLVLRQWVVTLRAQHSCCLCRTKDFSRNTHTGLLFESSVTIIKPETLTPNGWKGLAASWTCSDREKLWMKSPHRGLSSSASWQLKICVRCTGTCMLFLHGRSQFFCSACNFTAHTIFFCTHSLAKYRKLYLFYFMYAGHIRS